MRSVLWTCAGVLLTLAGTASAQVTLETVPDREWCDEGRSSEEQYCEVREATWPATGATLTIDASPNGGIAVEGWDRNEVRLRVKVVAEAGTVAAAQSLVKAVRIETEGVIRARTSGRAWASFRLDVPRGAALDLTSQNGGLHLRGLTGTVEARTTNGGVHLEQMAGRVTARTTNGGVHVQLSGHEWDGEQLDVTTSNGGVHLEIPADYNAHLLTGTVNGGIHAPRALQGRFDGKRLDAELGRGGALIHVETQNGGLHLSQG